MMKTKTSTLFLALIAAITEARHCGGSTSCGRSLYSPRRYNYHRRPNDAIDLVSDIFNVPFFSSNSLLRQHENQLACSNRSSGPRYAIAESEDGKGIELTMEVPGVLAKDMSVEVENGNVLRIRGSRTIRENGFFVQSQFDQAFELDEDIDVENIEVDLDAGVLTVSAPKKVTIAQRIPIAIREKVERNSVKMVGKRKMKLSETQEDIKDEGEFFVSTEEEDFLE